MKVTERSNSAGESMKNVRKLGLLLCVLGVAAGTLAQSSDNPKAGGPEASSDYVIGADDVLRISVWKEPELSEQLPVRPDGKISMPLLNDIPAAGLTPLALKDSITEKLKKYIADPRVTVVVTAMNSQRIFVTGEVVHSGPMNLLPPMTGVHVLVQAFFTQIASRKSICLLRAQNGKEQKVPSNYKDLVKGIDPEQNI